MIKPKHKSWHQSEMILISLRCACRPDHPLAQLAELIPRKSFEYCFGQLYRSNNGCLGLSDEEVVERWLDSSYAQYSCRETHFQQESLLDVSSLPRFHTRIGKLGCELTLKSAVMAGPVTDALKKSDLNRVTMDTTVQEKAVTYPTDVKLLNWVRERLVTKACVASLQLRQIYVRVGPRLFLKVNRNAELCRPQHASHSEENQDYLRRFLSAANFFAPSRKQRCCFSFSKDTLNMPENNLKQVFSDLTK